jgi:hypothetical protein
MMAEMHALIEEMTAKQVLVMTGGWNPASPSTVVKNSDGKLSVTDGPFAEAKELIAGYCIFDVATHDDALEWTRRFIRIAGDGAAEIRPLEH